MDNKRRGICHVNLAKGFRGGERQTLLMVKELSRAAEQTVAVRKGAALGERLSQIDRVGVVEIGKPFWQSLPAFKRFSLVHAHEAKAAQIAFLVKFFYKVPYIITRRVMKTPKPDFFTRAVYTNARQVIAISSPVEEVMRQYDRRIQTGVIPSSFASLDYDTDFVAGLKKKYRDRFVVGHVGALVNRDKGQLHLVNVAKKTAAAFPDIHYLFLGEGPDEKILRRKAAGLENVEFAGFKTNVGDYYSLFDIFAYPSLQEGLGSAVLDAFYFRLPVIASDVGGIPDLIDNYRTGILIPPADEAALYEKILELYRRRSLGETLGENGYRSLERFDVKNTASRYLNLYRACL